MTHRIAFLNTHPIQYLAPLYAYLNRAEDLDVTALYLSDFSIRGEMDRQFGQAVKWDIDLLEGYETRFVGRNARTNRIGGFWSMAPLELWSEIRRGRYDALVIVGHNLAAFHIALWAAKASRTPVFMRSDAHPGLKRSGWRARLHAPAMRLLYNAFDGAFAVGSANAAYYRAMGIPEDRIFNVPYAVDNDRFAAMADISPEERRALRASWGFTDDRPIIVFASKFTARKRPGDLMQACANLCEDGHRFHLLMIGRGEMEAELRGLAATLPDGLVSFTGFMNQSELPRAYAASDIFCLPSESEPWGVVVNEAMAAGLPVVASREIGSVQDLVRDGENGHTFQAGDVQGLAASLERLISGPARRAQMANASRQIIGQWSYAECLDGVRAAMNVTWK